MQNFIDCREVRGPVLDITVLDGVILAAAGTRLEVLELKGKTLQRTAFYDAQILLRSVSVIKDYILLGDVHKSLTFVHSSQRCRQLNELSKVCIDCHFQGYQRAGGSSIIVSCSIVMSISPPMHACGVNDALNSRDCEAVRFDQVANRNENEEVQIDTHVFLNDLQLNGDRTLARGVLMRNSSCFSTALWDRPAACHT